MAFKVGIVDTTFARYDMSQDVIEVMDNYYPQITYERYTVPGIKDLPVACKIMFVEHECDIVVALGMPGPKDYDKISAQVASQGIVQCQLDVRKHILEVFVHEDEGEGNDEKLKSIMKDRAKKHAINAVNLMLYPEKMRNNAGTGLRQGHKNAKPIK